MRRRTFLASGLALAATPGCSREAPAALSRAPTVGLEPVLTARTLETAAALPRAEALRDRQAAGRVEVGVKLAASARMVLADVEAALARMDDGTYGTCRLCRRTIDRERLMIVPQARYCARCQQVKEAQR